jgi:hypothetical protein
MNAHDAHGLSRRQSAGARAIGVIGCRVHGRDEPLRILRVAWNNIPLATIRAAVDEAIAGLHVMTPREVLGRDLSSFERESTTDPVIQALHACCDELREGSGLPVAPTAAERAKLVGGASSSDWTESYDNALEMYRGAAGLALQASFRKR